MLVEYLDDAAKDMSELKVKAQSIRKKYDSTADRDLLNEIASLNKKAKIKKMSIWENIYENVEEFRFMKKHFPQLFQIYAEDDAIGKFVRKKEWLANFEQMSPSEALRKIEQIKNELKQIKKIKKASKNWQKPFTDNMLGENWEKLKLKITDKTDHDELDFILNEEADKLRREGWRVVLNEPLIMKPVSLFLERLKNAILEEQSAKQKMEESNGRGIYWEHKAKRDYELAVRKRKNIEVCCKHLLLSNPQFLKKFKKQGMFWRDRNIAEFMKVFFESINVPEINEKEWLIEMKKKLES
jgi:hypothetical protein